MAPFKAQNMSNNSAVTVDGGEIGRAQAMQARAAGLAPHTRFNPILLKPGSDRTSQLVLHGRVVDVVGAKDYFTHREHLAAVVSDELQRLRTEFDAVIVEGAGSPAEINLRATDIANMGLARAANCRSSSSAISTAAGCSPTCSGRWRCSNPRTNGWSADSLSTSSAATPRCWRRG